MCSYMSILVPHNFLYLITQYDTHPTISAFINSGPDCMPPLAKIDQSTFSFAAIANMSAHSNVRFCFYKVKWNIWNMKWNELNMKYFSFSLVSKSMCYVKIVHDLNAVDWNYAFSNCNSVADMVSSFYAIIREEINNSLIQS